MGRWRACGALRGARGWVPPRRKLCCCCAVLLLMSRPRRGRPRAGRSVAPSYTETRTVIGPGAAALTVRGSRGGMEAVNSACPEPIWRTVRGLSRAAPAVRRCEVGCGARPLRYGAVVSAGRGAGLGGARPGRIAGWCGRWLRSRRRERRRCTGEGGPTGAEVCGVRRRQVGGRALAGAAGASGAAARRARCRSRRGPCPSGPLRQRAGGPGGLEESRRRSGSARRAFRSWGAAVLCRGPSRFGVRPPAGPGSGGPGRVSSGVRP